MSYIEQKYYKSIIEIFEELASFEKNVVKRLELKSLKEADDLAKLCADLNKKINLILKKYYPEIVDMEKKLKIKSTLKFYYDFINKIVNFVRAVENFEKIDARFYDQIIEFIEDKDDLIQGKYREICTQELTAFYDPKSRNNLEKIIEQKFSERSRQFFTMGPLEEEIKKIGKIAGADLTRIYTADSIRMQDFKIIDNPRSVINYSIFSEDEDKLKSIGKELRDYLISKGYEAVVLLVELTDLTTNSESLMANIITDAKLLPD